MKTFSTKRLKNQIFPILSKYQEFFWIFEIGVWGIRSGPTVFLTAKYEFSRQNWSKRLLFSGFKKIFKVRALQF